MTKAAKKKNRRLKKAVRKTLGTLFLVSAIVVAAIPVEGLQANTAVQTDREAESVTFDSKGNIPQITEETTIYTTGDRRYRFAYISDGGTDKIAVILGYSALTLENNVLEIPETVDAYAKFTESMGTDKGYVAVGKNGNFLFYKKVETYETPKLDASGNTVSDGDGNIVMETKENISYIPCYYDNIAEWGELAFDQLYYDGTDPDGTLHPGVALDPDNAKQTTDPQYQQIKGATVSYISNQYLIQNSNGDWEYNDGQYVDESTKDYGIFANSGNIKTLIVSENLLGIGDYAFYRCGYLESISLGNGLNTIGNGAFSDCVNMTSIDLDIGSNLNKIGAKAFYNCQQLQSFTLPIQVSEIGDSAFEGCTSLSYVDLCSQGKSNVLSKLGRDMFVNCESLESLTFPYQYTDPVYISAFEGCRSLRYISTRNKKITFLEETGVYTYDEFKAMLEGTPVNGAFYFEGIEGSTLHQLTKDNRFAFSYIDFLGGQYINLDRYELTVAETGGDATYEVNSSRRLISCKTDPGVKTITIPGRIGPYAVNYIDSITFQDHCNIEMVTIPSNVLEIGDEAFRGCHNLNDVIFESSDVTIGSNAFKTQDTKSHESSCPDNGSVETDPSDNTPVEKLNFIGPISSSSKPFQYAMSEGGKYNIESQQPTYITYYSGWPKNLKIEYNPKTGMSELVDFPSFSDLKNGKYNSTDYAYITTDHQKAANEALNKYPAQEDDMTEYEMQIVNAALRIEIPSGVESVKTGLFKEKETSDTVSYAYPREVIAYSLKEIECTPTKDADGNITGATGTFADCDLITNITLWDGVGVLDDYAFYDCDALEYVTLPSTLETVGLKPFIGCGSLQSVDFQGHPDYVCSNGIIYGPDSEGNPRTKIVEFLESRKSGVVSTSEIAGVTEIADEAFRGTGVSNIDFNETTITNIPAWAFADTYKLSSVKLPYTCRSILENAFKNSALEYIEIPVETQIIVPDSFSNVQNPESLVFCCEPNSIAEDYAKAYGFSTTEKPIERHYTVTFWDWDAELETNVVVDTQTVEGGHDAEPPEPRGKEGYVFVDWTFPYTGISRDIDLTARYEKEDENLHKFAVTFKDSVTNETLEVVMVDPGATARAPEAPVKDGLIFTGWQPSVENITEDTTIWAMYDDRPEDTWVVQYYDEELVLFYTTTVKTGEDAPNITAPEVEGKVFSKWIPGLTGITEDTKVYAKYESASGSDSDGSGSDGSGNTGSNNNGGNGSNNSDGSNGSNNTGSSNTSTKLYTLTVRNGSGSGSYIAGSQPVIIANDPASGQEFSHWTIDPEDTTIASKVLSATVITMPENSVTITAHYKAKTSTTTGSGNSSNVNSNRPNSNAGSLESGGTTVVIDKNGLSNTGVVSATVNGSSDDFTIKITESSAASEAAVKALLAEYGDLNNIKYFPMDISLYDSTGKKKITDTQGLSISITLPLPDSLITYAGNNKVASVVNDRLDKLSAKFTTISGVSCVTFTAEHFSPYVIYVDTDNLTAGTITDSTPKTGDGIHPKWFLSIGLACISVVLFMKKDKKTVRQATA